MFRISVCVALISLLTTASLAEEQAESQRSSTYAASRKLAVELFGGFYKRESVNIRIGAILEACDKDGLAKAVEAMQRERSDKEFYFELVKRMTDGDGYKEIARPVEDELITVELGARSLLVGYAMGYKEAVRIAFQSLLTETIKSSVCEGAIKNANDLLR